MSLKLQQLTGNWLKRTRFTIPFCRFKVIFKIIRLTVAYEKRMIFNRSKICSQICKWTVVKERYRVELVSQIVVFQESHVLLLNSTLRHGKFRYQA